MDMPTKPEMIYFGLLPHKRDPEVDMVHTGFQGCMSHLQVRYICTIGILIFLNGF